MGSRPRSCIRCGKPNKVAALLFEDVSADRDWQLPENRTATATTQRVLRHSGIFGRTAVRATMVRIRCGESNKWQLESSLPWKN